MNASFVSRILITKMLRILVVCVCYAALALSAAVASAADSQGQASERAFSENPRVVIETTEGNIEIELLPKFAPKHVNNFLDLVEKEFYSGLIFHRVIPNFIDSSRVLGSSSSEFWTQIPCNLSGGSSHL